MNKIIKEEVKVLPKKSELQLKIDKYEEELKAHKLVNNVEMVAAITSELDGLKIQLMQER